MKKTKAAMGNLIFHHHIAKPISLHSHPQVAKATQVVLLVLSIIPIALLVLLVYVMHFVLKGSPSKVLLAVALPAIVAAILLGFFIYYRKTFYRELASLKRKFKLKLEHGFRHR